MDEARRQRRALRQAANQLRAEGKHAEADTLLRQVAEISVLPR
jgi:hypothetical protein